MPEFSRFKLEVGQLFWDGGSTWRFRNNRFWHNFSFIFMTWSFSLLRKNSIDFFLQFSSIYLSISKLLQFSLNFFNLLQFRPVLAVNETSRRTDCTDYFAKKLVLTAPQTAPKWPSPFLNPGTFHLENEAHLGGSWSPGSLRNAHRSTCTSGLLIRIEMPMLVCFHVWSHPNDNGIGSDFIVSRH